MRDSLKRLVAEAANQPASEEAARRALASLDLTSLGLDDTEEKITALCERAITAEGNTAAVCVYDKFVPLCRKLLDGKGVRVATVCNFPHGNMDIPAAVAEAEAQVEAGAHEVDVVLPYRTYLAGNREQAIQLVHDVRVTCGEQTKLKVIIESGELKDPEIILAASIDCIDAGADFIKTSTGKASVGATLEAAAIMIDAIAQKQHASLRTLGFKPAGGISSVADAAAYLYLADQIMGRSWATPETFRFGASGVLTAILAELGVDTGSTETSGY